MISNMRQLKAWLKIPGNKVVMNWHWNPKAVMLNVPRRVVKFKKTEWVFEDGSSISAPKAENFIFKSGGFALVVPSETETTMDNGKALKVEIRCTYLYLPGDPKKTAQEEAEKAHERFKLFQVSRAMIGLAGMQVCAPKDATDKELLDFANLANPSGTEGGWTIVVRKNSKLYGNNEPVQCKDHADKNHYIIIC